MIHEVDDLSGREKIENENDESEERIRESFLELQRADVPLKNIWTWTKITKILTL